MKPTELRFELNRRLRQGRADLAWERGLAAYRDGKLQSVTRMAAETFLQTLARDHLPVSFWKESRQKEADEVGAEPRYMPGVVGRVSFPVVVDGGDPNFFAEIMASRDEFPDGPLHGLDDAGRAAVAAGEAEARMLTGDRQPIHYRIEAPKDLLPIKGPSCGLAAALAAISLFEKIPVEDGIVATGQVRPGGVFDVGGLEEKARLRTEARPLARMFVPTGTIEGDGLVPVPNLRAVRKHLAEPDERAQREALREYLAQLSQDPALRRMNLQGLHGVRSGPHSTELDILDLAVPPSFEAEATAEVHDERRAQVLAEDVRPDRDDDQRKELAHNYRTVEALEHTDWGRGDNVSLDQLLWRKRVLILGDAGMGKSTVVRLITLACGDNVAGARARSLMSRPDRGERLDHLRSLVPVRLSFGRLAERLAANPSWSLPDGVRAELRALDAPVALVHAMDGALERGECLLLLDGLDEAPEAMRERAARAVEEYVTRFPECRLVVTTRPHGYRPRIAGLVHVKIRPYGHEERRQLVERMLRATRRLRGDRSTDAQTSTQAKAILARIGADEKLRELTTNPLLLTLVALLPQGSAVSHRVVVYENFVRTLVETWARQRQAPIRTNGGPSAEALLEAWSAFAKVCVRKEQRHGLKRSRCLRILEKAADVPPELVMERGLEDGLVREVGDDLIAFAHSSYGEFLAARTLTPTESIDGAGLRILEEVTQHNLSPFVLQLAAARLAVVEDAQEEVEALIDGLLALDREDTLKLEMPGLRLASGIVADRVPVSTTLRDKVLKRWIRLGEGWAPSLYGEGFARVLAGLEEPRLPLAQLERLLGLFEGQARDVREQMLRLAATATTRSTVAQAVCRAVDGFTGFTHGLEGHLAARGLARCGEWSDKVVAALATYAEHEEPPFKETTALVRSMPQEFVTPIERRLREMEAELAQEGRRGGVRTRSFADDNVMLLALRAVVPRGLVPVLAHRGDRDQAILRHLALSSRTSFEAIGALLANRALGNSLLKNVLVPVAVESEACISLLIDAFHHVPPEDQRGAWQATHRVLAEQPAAEDLLRRLLVDSDDGKRSIAAAVLFQAQPGDPAVTRALIRGGKSAEARWRKLCARVILEGPVAEVGPELLHAAALVELADVAGPPQTMNSGWTVNWWPDERRCALLVCLADRSAAGTVRVAAAERLNAENAREPETLALIRGLLVDRDSAVRGRAACRLYELGFIDEAIVGELIYCIKEREHGRRAHDPWLRRDLPIDDLPHLAAKVLARAAEIDPRVSAHEKFAFRNIAIGLVVNAVKSSSVFIEPVLRAFESGTLAAELAAQVLYEVTGESPAHWEAIKAGSERAGLSAIACFNYCRLFRWHRRPHSFAVQRLQTCLLVQNPDLGEWHRLEAARLLADADRLEPAERVWRGLLPGEYALRAAEDLVEQFELAARPWIEEAIERMLGEVDMEDAWPVERRLRLVRLALGLGIGREKAVECAVQVLRQPCDLYAFLNLVPLDLDTDRADERKRTSLREISGYGSSDSHGFVLDLLLRQAPEQAAPFLLEWLEGPERFTVAVKCLRHLGLHAEEVTAALHKTVESGGAGESRAALALLEEAQAIDGRVVEILIRQMLGDGSNAPDEFRSNQATEMLARCARAVPGVSTAIRKHRESGPCGEDRHLTGFLNLAGPVDGDALELLLDMGMGSFHTMHLAEVWRTWTRPAAPDETPEGSPGQERPQPPSSIDEEAFRHNLSERFLARWNPKSAYETLDHDNVAAALGIDVALRAEKLRNLLDPRDPVPAHSAAWTLLALGVFDPQVESLVWALLEAPIDLNAEDRRSDDPTVPEVLRLDQRVNLLKAMYESRGPSERLGGVALAVADTPGLAFWRRRYLVDSLPLIPPWEGPTAAWIAKHLAAAPLEEVAEHGHDFIRGAAIPRTLWVQTVLTAVGALPGSRSIAVNHLASLIGDPGAPGLADDANPEKWRVRDLGEPTGRTAFFDWAERLAAHVALDEVLWSLGELAETALHRYRQAMEHGIGDLEVELSTVLRRRPPEGPLSGPPRDRVVNFAREWLTYRLLKPRPGKSTMGKH